ncbi:hypothetical protein PVAND_009020 [Polypedilum vanderplanki]|uniref:Tumor protein p53-inducible nuclear protein 1 n=1 Tax=Polypedilum vanderplanki TaxID=319348 RepID=A0A9J6CBT3_POLVA|nr:hypothetical protein PVAND_009020 [Polypedilum vanderplanki]
MFNGLFSSLFGKSKEDNNFSPDVKRENNGEQQVVDALEARNILSEIDGNVRVVLLDDEDKDWLFVETDTQHPSLIAPSDDEEEEEEDKKTNNLQLVPFKSILSHLSTVRENDENCLLSANLPALYPNTMDESWFLTPPSCFNSASIQLETSPIENLLIEHPSMSVYHNIRRGQLKTSGLNNEEIIEDLVVLELSQNDDAIIVNKGNNKRNKGNKNNKNSKPRPNGSQQQPKSVALVVVTKSSGASKGESRNVAMSRSFFERNNKTTRNSYKKNLHTINQPSSRTMSRKN